MLAASAHGLGPTGKRPPTDAVVLTPLASALLLGRSHGQAIGNLSCAVELLKELLAGQAMISAGLAFSGDQFDSPVAGGTLGTLDV
jgi:hypothetical protein